MFPQSFKHIAHCWASLIAEEVARLGVKDVCIAPGSRSTPLVMACSTHHNLTCHTHFDERSLGFYALGLAKATHQPVVIITTSGSAVANLLPAVVEAFHSSVPLIIFSADRPFQDHYHGANQTINQNNMFGSFSKQFYTIPTPTESISPAWLIATVDEAIFQATMQNPAPVHINIMFDESFFDIERSFDSYLSPLHHWLNSTKSAKQLHPIKSTLNPMLPSTDVFNNVIAVVGEIASQDDAIAIAAYCSKHNIPILTECHSKLFGFKNTIHCVDLFFANFKKTTSEPYTVLLFGEHIISKQCLTFIKHAQKCIHISDNLRSNNPLHSTYLTLKTPYLDALEYLSLCHFKQSQSWVDSIASVHQTVTQSIQKTSYEHVSEISVLNQLFKTISPSSLIFVSNSLSIRLLNSFVHTPHHHLVYANRGASGIDGNLSTAIGLAKAHNSELVLICGDLTFLYDLNALALLKTSHVTLKICLFNNNGGQIFSFLPIKNHTKSLDPYFTTPHNSTFENIAKQFELHHLLVTSETVSALDQHISHFLNASSSTLLECVFTDSETKQHIALHSNTFL